MEHLHWGLYAEQGKGLLDHLGIQQAFVLGGCMGVSVAIAFGTRYPRSTIALLLHWPVGGYQWRVMASERFTAHRNYVRECLPHGDFWPVMPPDQTPERVAERLIAFGAAHR